MMTIFCLNHYILTLNSVFAAYKTHKKFETKTPHLTLSNKAA